MAELGSWPDRVKELAKSIRASVPQLNALPEVDEVEEDAEFAEGATATVVHLRRERARKIRPALLAKRAQSNSLHCDACGLKPPMGGDLAVAVFEAHHVVPLSQGATKTRLEDMALLCANCHRLIHRVMAKERRWLPVPEFSKLLTNAAK